MFLLNVCVSMHQFLQTESEGSGKPCRESVCALTDAPRPQITA